jgi:hypothetical protein
MHPTHDPGDASSRPRMADGAEDCRPLFEPIIVRTAVGVDALRKLDPRHG